MTTEETHLNGPHGSDKAMCKSVDKKHLTNNPENITCKECKNIFNNWALNKGGK